MTAKPVVAATDGSEESLRAVEWAASEAARRGAGLQIVSAVSLPPVIGLQVRPDRDVVAHLIRAERDRALAAAATRAAEIAPGLLVGTEPLAGQPAHAVTSSGSGASMLVLGSRGSGGFASLVLGSVSRYAAAHATCPVVVVRDGTAAVHRRVGIGIGDLDACADSLSFAFEEAALRKVSLVAIHARHMLQFGVPRAGTASPVPDTDAADAEDAALLQGLLDKWRHEYPEVRVSQDIIRSHPGRALVGLSARADLVVIGRHAKHPGPQGPGSVRHAVLSHALGPVVVVPSS